MYTNKSHKVLTILVTLIMIFSMLFTTGGVPSAKAAPTVPVTFTILHTNDFHGQLEPAGSNPGMARVANYVNSVRTALGDSNVLLVDAGDEMQGSLLSNLGDGTPTGKGIPTIDTYNTMSYDAATFGNHEFDWGQVNLANRTTEATYPYVTANIVQNDTGDCATAGWNPPTFADAPYQILEAGVTPNTVKVAFIGVTSTETPTITVATSTAGLCFKDPANSILHYYDAMKAAGADVIVVLSHIGYADGGYGYGIPVYGDQTLAATLNTAGKPVNLIIGGHSHTNLTSATTVGTTKVVQAYYNGRRVGRADITVGTDGSVAITWASQTIGTSDPQDPTIDALIDAYVADPDYQALVNTPIGYSTVDLPRFGGVTDNMMGAFIDDAIYNYLNTDAETANDVDIFFNNAGGIRADWCWNGSDWVNTGCVSGTHAAGLLTYGDMFTVLPFGNATAVGKMTGAKILEVLHNAASIANSASSPAGAIQPAGLKYTYYAYKDTNPGPQPYAWGAYDVTVYDKVTHGYVPLDLTKTYNVGTNEFLAPAGGDNYSAFKYMTNITYWGDMLNAVNAYVNATYGTELTAYAGPNGDGTLDGRITLNGDGDTSFDGGAEIVPLTLLHHNDSHGNVYKGTFVGYTQLATLIKQERLHNPSRTLLLNSGDDIQGDGFSFFYKSSYSGKAVDGTVLDPGLWTNPVIAVMNSMNYDAMTLGNHEFNFGSDVFKGVLGQATFPVLQANVTDSGAYGLAAANGGVGVQPYVTKTVGAEGIKVAILGIGNHRVPNYELPSNIPGLTFSDPIAKAQELSTALRGTNDVLIALTHIGFTENPASVEVDANVDTNLVATVTGLDALVGGHSHTNPATGFGAYKYLPSIVVDPDGKPVIVSQAYRYNNTLGEEVLGLRAKGGGGYEVVSGTGRYLTVAMSTTEDAATKAIVDPYLTPFNTYNNTVVGVTTTPIDALQAFTQETSGANLQADSSIYELTKNGITPDFHLSGAMTNKATSGPYPQTLKVSDMFTLMPYENSLVVISMNGPQLKTILERAYRNYYYYKYVPNAGGYSYYTTCMLDTNFGNQITYNDLYPALPSGNNVVSLKIGGVPVDFTDAATYYNVSTVNYLAAGSCNFNDAGVTLWPLDQIVADTQYYVRDAVIDYITYKGTVSPAIEGRVNFDFTPPVLTITGATADGVDMAGDLATGFILPTTSVSTIDHLIQFKAGTTADETLASDYFGLKLINSTVTPAVIKAYYTARGVPEPFLTYLNGAADGTNPFVYIKGSTVKLVDAAKHDLLGSDVDMTIPDDFPLGTYTVEGKIKDLADNETTVTLKLIVADGIPPTVTSIHRVNASPTNLASVNFTVTFSESVTGVDVTDFSLTTTGILAATVSSVSGSGATYTVSVNTGAGNGTIRLDVVNDGTIIDLASNLLAGGFSSGETYIVYKAPINWTNWYGGAVIESDQSIISLGEPQIGSEAMVYDGFVSGSKTMYVPMLFKRIWGSYDSALYIQNTDPTNAAHITIKFFDTDGNLSCTKTDTIPLLSSHGYWLPDESCLPSTWVGGVVVTSDQDIVSVGRPQIGNEITSYTGFASGDTIMYVPMLFKNIWGYDSAFYVQNIDPTNPADITIKYYDTDGNLSCTMTDTIPRLSSHGYWLPFESCLPSSWVGGVVVTSSQNIVAVGRPHLGSSITAYNGVSSGIAQTYVPGLFKNSGGKDAALYVQNTDPTTTADITLKFYDTDGNLSCTMTDAIPRLSSHGYWLPYVTCLPSSWVGSVIVESNVNVVSVGRPHVDDDVASYNGFSGGSTLAYVPMLFKNMWTTYNSTLRIQNLDAGNAASVIIKFFDVDGNLSCVKADTIPALSVLSYWLPDLTCSP